MGVGLQLCRDETVVLWRALERNATIIGSNPDCDVCVPHDAVASVQCVIERRGRELWLINHAPEGTRVGAETVDAQVRLAEGDVLHLGSMRALVRFDRQTQGVGGTRTLPFTGQEVSELALLNPVTQRRWALGSGGLSIGTDPKNDIVLEDPYVSAFHARVHSEAGRCMLRDLDSRNGSFIGEQKVREAEVPLGESLRLGRTTLRVIAPGDPGEVRAEQGLRLIGGSAAMARLRELIARVADTAVPVLLTGETGTGKEVVARCIAAQSRRAARPFVALNCGSLSRTLIESELFGHEKGAFTGAATQRPGAFEAAHTGTLFLDELGELPLELQPQLLRVLESGEVKRVGSSEAFRVDVRLVAATNRRLAAEVQRGAFREDLYHRLQVVVLDLPPLRARREDIPELAWHFLEDLCPAGQALELTPGAMEKLVAHDWPGNVRELRNVLQRAVLLRHGDTLDAADLVFPPSTLATRVEVASAAGPRTLQEIERAAIVGELRRHGGNKTEAATALGISRSTMHRKIEEYRIDAE